jgi:kinesin family member 5
LTCHFNIFSMEKKKTERVVVYLRVRPQSEEELRSTGRETIIDTVDSNRGSIVVRRDSEKKQFSYDSVFDQYITQKEVYTRVGQPVVDCVLEGYNGTILAYGQTGTGKTHTMIGGPGELKGIIPRCMKQIFTTIQKSTTHTFSVKIGFIQLYMEVLQDLIRPDPNNPIKIREDADEGVYLAGVSWIDVTSVSECMNLMATGDKNRNVASTSMNSTSSRSHAVYMVKIEKRKKMTKEEIEQTGKAKFSDNSMTKSTLYLVDLAGSERVSKTKVSGVRLDEAKNINLALLALGNCIQALAEGKSKYIPFRDSKLTRLLEDSLGGNSKTSLVVTIGPAVNNYQESLSSLFFASRAMKIQNSPEINIKIDYKALCAQLQAELDKVNDGKNIENMDINKLIEENNNLKQTIDRLTSEKLQLEVTLEELKKGSDCSIIEGSNAEFQKIQRHYKNKLEKQEQDHKKFLQEIDKMLLDQEEQINSMKNSNIELENSNTQITTELKRCQLELEHEKNDREMRSAQMVNEIEDLKQKVLLEKARCDEMQAENERLKGSEMKKSNSTNTLHPIKMKPATNKDLQDKILQYETMVANLEEEVAQYERKMNDQVVEHHSVCKRYEAEIAGLKDSEKKHEAEIRKLKKQQAKLIKAFRGLEKKSEEEIKNLQEEIERQSVSHNSKRQS